MLVCAPQLPNGRPCSCAAVVHLRGGRRLPVAMVFIDNWESFYKEAEKLYVEHPDHVRPATPPVSSRTRSHSSLRRFTSRPGQTRFVTKYRHCDGKLELKVTNDRVVRTPSSSP